MRPTAWAPSSSTSTCAEGCTASMAGRRSHPSMPKRILLLALLWVSFASQAAEPMPPVRQIHAARHQVVKWMRGHEGEREAVASAYARNDIAWLEKEAARLNRQPGFADPNRTLMRAEFGPFLKCDTAQRDLGMLAAAMVQHSLHGTPTAARVVQEEQADYDRAAAICKRRLDMAPGIAWAEYQAE
jgi:hypothetical protein